MSDRNEEYVMGNWRKGHPYHKEEESLSELCSVGLQEEIVSGESNKPKKEFLTRMWRCGNCQPIHVAQNEEACSGENTRGVAGQPFAKETRHVICESNPPFQQKHLQLGLTETEMRWNKGRLSDFWDSTGRKQANRIIWLWISVILWEKGRMTSREVQRPVDLSLTLGRWG